MLDESWGKAKTNSTSGAAYINKEKSFPHSCRFLSAKNEKKIKKKEDKKTAEKLSHPAAVILQERGRVKHMEITQQCDIFSGAAQKNSGLAAIVAKCCRVCWWKCVEWTCEAGNKRPKAKALHTGSHKVGACCGRKRPGSQWKFSAHTSHMSYVGEGSCFWRQTTWQQV